jgi:hypothetical protein
MRLTVESVDRASAAVKRPQYARTAVTPGRERISRASPFWCIGFGPKIASSVAAQPEGLLLHENIVYSLFPPHVGMRQYWRDFESLEHWTRAEPHRLWWTEFLKNNGGTGFWHELYSIRGGFESVYVEVQQPIGFLKFAKALPAKGGLFSARERLRRGGKAETPAPYQETEL